MTYMSQEKQRDEGFDIAKGIAMLCIIAGHMSVDSINRFVFTFHVPIFFIISGYFYRNSKNIIKKKARQLIFPYLVTTLFLCALSVLKIAAKILIKGEGNVSDIASSAIHVLLAGLYGSGSREDFFSFTLPTIGAIWFLLALLWVIIFMKMMNIFINDNVMEQWLFVFILFLIGYTSAKCTWMPLSIQSGMVSLLFFYIGYFIKQRNFKWRDINHIKLIAAASVWLCAIVASYCRGLMAIVEATFPNGILDILGAVAASYLILCFSNVLAVGRNNCREAYWRKYQLQDLIREHNIVQYKLRQFVSVVFEKLVGGGIPTWQKQLISSLLSFD